MPVSHSGLLSKKMRGFIENVRNLWDILAHFNMFLWVFKNFYKQKDLSLAKLAAEAKRRSRLESKVVMQLD